MEFLGAVSASVQLIDIGVRIAHVLTDTYQQVRDAPNWVQTRTDQIETLITAVKSVKSKPHLRTAEITSIIKSCLSQAQELQKILESVCAAPGCGRGKRLQKALEAVFKEKRVLELLDSLERDKNSLIMCIV
jgi:hypothetical protein